jgi:hypothetical protein
MRGAAVVAIMLAASSVISTACLAVAVITASQELGVQRVQGVGVNLADLLVAQVGEDMLVDVSAVRVQGLAGDAQLAEVALQ